MSKPIPEPRISRIIPTIDRESNYVIGWVFRVSYEDDAMPESKTFDDLRVATEPKPLGDWTRDALDALIRSTVAKHPLAKQLRELYVTRRYTVEVADFDPTTLREK